ncbi:MAG TPA: insulinase family protein [Thermoanaerobaculia bacterium]|nr:insulinase family protein [Thermoanaerobaculia bacterium]
MKFRTWTSLPAALALVAACTTASSAPPEPDIGPAPAATTVAPAAPAATPAPDAAAAPATAPELDLDAPLPFDPAVRRGELENGIDYYIRQNPKPEKRAELRLVIDVGSLVEDDDQRGLAHFVEHMAFNGSRNFEKQELVDYLEGIGMRFGPDLNAYTSFDETVYMLQVPTDDDEILAKAFLILEDWAHGVSFDGEEIDKERGVVVEEWRQGRGAGGRIRDRQLPVTFHGSRYAERNVIGEKTVLETAPHEALRRFYRDWYRPDLMAVVAVGDFDVEQVETKIRQHFSKLEPREAARERADFPIPDHAETLTSIATDPEATSINVTVGYKRPPMPTETVGDMRRALIDGLYHGMMNNRLQELSLLPDPPFLYGFASSGWLGRTKSMYRLAAGVPDGGVVRGLETLLLEARRVEEHGFLASELERSKVNVLRSIDRAFDERDKQESGRYASQYVGHFLDDDPAPGIEFLRDLYHRLVPEIAIEEINARAAQWITEENRVILVSGPDKADAGIPEEQALLAVFDEVDQVAVLPWVDRTRDEPLVAETPTPGVVVSEERIEELGVVRWKLANGVSLLLKPTDFKNDEVLLSGYSPGGHSLVDDERYTSAAQAASIAGEMGLGNFDQIELGKALAGKVAFARPFVGELAEGISGAASPNDLETLFQLVHLHFGAMRRDEDAFASYVETLRGRLQNQEASPGFWFEKKWAETAFGDHPRRQPFTLARVPEVDLDQALAVYRDRFADASDFQFTLVGSFDPEIVRPLVETWLGSLPALRRDETWRDVEAFAREGAQRFQVRKGIEPKSSVRLVHHGFTEWSPERAHVAASLGQALRIRLREVLREDLGGVYGVGASVGVSRWPRARYNASVSFGCDPERVDELLSAVRQEIAAFRADGPSEEIVGKVREMQRRSRETALQQNRFWLSQLQDHEVNGLPLTDILRFEERLAGITREALRDAAREYFDEARFIEGVLYPEETAAGGAAAEKGGETDPE